MTVIAWDGETLAADKFADIYGVAFTTTKIHRVLVPGRGVALAGFSGAGARGRQLLHWYTNGADPNTFPPQPTEDDRACILVCITRAEDGHVVIERFESTGFPIVLEDRLFADGSGRDVALAAMYCGKSASEAVELTGRIIPRIGGGIDTLTFEDVPTCTVTRLDGKPMVRGDDGLSHGDPPLFL